MSTDKHSLIKEITSAFSLTGEAAQTALLLLEARAKTLQFSFDEYMERYHPQGLAERDENLDKQFEGYVQFLGDDAQAVLRAGKGADFSTFVHECAHVFRRQLAGELRHQAEKAFGITDGNWNVKKEELFAKGLEQWIKRRHGRDKTRANVYNKGRHFVDKVYRGMEHIVDVDKKMEVVYERLFEDTAYRFNQDEYEKTLKYVAEGNVTEGTHVFLGMTARIYEELGFERLPMAITKNHLQSTMKAGGDIRDAHYNNLGEDVLKQIPEQLKKPICIVQSPNDETEIISIVRLTDNHGNAIIVPIAQFMQGNINRAEIDINLVKSIYGKNGFENWLKAAIDDDRLLYVDKKNRTGHEWEINSTLSRAVLSSLPGSNSPILQDISGFVTSNISRYREAVKLKFPGRFTSGERILYKRKDSHSDQLSLDFSSGAENRQEVPGINIPQPNTPDYFTQNFAALAGSFKNDTIEAARFLLRSMTKEDRQATLTAMRDAGCADRESYHNYLHSVLDEQTSVQFTKMADEEQARQLLDEIRLSPQEMEELREKVNNHRQRRWLDRVSKRDLAVVRGLR